MTSGWPLVGRVEELSLIHDMLIDPSIRCVALTGDAGVGKTRLAREFAGASSRDRWTVRSVTASEELRAIALGALSPVLPSRLPEAVPLERFELIGWARRALLAGAARRNLLVVDDAPLLDDLTVALVQQLTSGDWPIHLLLTARTGTLPRWMANLTRDDGVEHVRIQTLAEPDVTALLGAALGGPVDPATQAMLWAHSGGNPLWLRSLLHDGRESGALEQRDGIWVWSGLATAGSLADVLSTRLAGLSPADTEAMELIAIGEPVPLPVIGRLGIERSVAVLERRDLVEVGQNDRVRVAHPLFGSLVRSQVTGMGAQLAHRRLADAFEAGGVRDGVDGLRLARWLLELGDTADPELILSACRHALLLDAALAERFARLIPGADADFALRLCLARALVDQQRIHEALTIYRALLMGELTPGQRAEVTMQAAFFHFWSDGDPRQATKRLRRAGSDLPDIASQCVALCSAIDLYSGASESAVQTALTVASNPSETPEVVLLAALAAVPALTVTGRVAQAVALAENVGTTFTGSEIEPVPRLLGPTYSDAQLEWEYAFALRWAGRVGDAVAVTTASLHSVAERADRHPPSYALIAAAAGGAQLAAGDIRAAVEKLRAAASALRAVDWTGTLVACLAELARAEALSGNQQAAEAALAQANEWRKPWIHLFDAPLGVARSVVAAAGGDLSRARDEARSAAETARRWSQPVLEAASLHLVVRFGNPAAVLARLTVLAQTTDAGMLRLFAAHAEAATAKDAAALERAAEGFAAAGTNLLAAQTFAHAARAHRRSGQKVAADRAAQRSREFSARCPDAPLPALLVEPIPLTARERDIVGLASRGLTNQQIADDLTVSVRTVESHLQHAYVKLGVSSRESLVMPPAVE